MAQNICHVLFWLSFVWPSLCADLDLDNDFPEDRWIFRHSQLDRKQENEIACATVKPSARDIVRRFYAILPYFDKDHTNTAFLHKFRGTIYSMSDSEDMLDREAGFYAAVLTPLVFLQQYRDTWCLLERFHRAIRLYQISHPTEKRSALKLLQNLRAVNQKIRGFIFELPGPEQPPRTTPAPDDDEETLNDKKDIRYLKELIKNLGNLIWPALRREHLEHGEQPSAVLIQFDDCTINADENGLVRVEPCLTEFDGLRGSGKKQRKMLPLILTWAVTRTVHKLHGCTLDIAVIDLGKSLFAKGQAYITLSRLRSLDGLFICSLDHNKLLKNPHDSGSLQELERLRSLSNLET